MELALLVQKYAKGFLNGDSRLFANLLHESWKRTGAYEREDLIARVRKDAENAWHEQDYTKVVEIYNIIREDLTPVELKKLEYAQKRLNR